MNYSINYKETFLRYYEHYEYYESINNSFYEYFKSSYSTDIHMDLDDEDGIQVWL
jgi:hypothetical protein